MSVRIDIDQQRTVEEGPLYRVVTSVFFTTGIDRNIFVFNTETDAYEHVASPWDMENLPTSKAQAITDDVTYYRLAAVTKDWEDVGEATEFAAYTLSRISSLAQQFGLVESAFEGSGTYSYTGE